MISYDYQHPRSALSITLSVWRALFLRESIGRISARRYAWAWLLIEPLIQIAMLLVIFTVIRMRVVSGIDTATWLIVGIVFFLMFKRTATQSQNALSSNQALFAYRQVTPVDTVLVRATLEGFLTTLTVIIISFGSALFDINLTPDDPLIMLTAYLGLWLMGIGYGLITSVAIKLIPELGKVLGFVMTPIYLSSGAILPISSIPMPYRDWILYNPIAHGLEAARLGASSYYHAVPGVNLAYLYECALIGIFFGLVLYKRFAAKLTMK